MNWIKWTKMAKRIFCHPEKNLQVWKSTYRSNRTSSAARSHFSWPSELTGQSKKISYVFDMCTTKSKHFYNSSNGIFRETSKPGLVLLRVCKELQWSSNTHCQGNHYKMQHGKNEQNSSTASQGCGNLLLPQEELTNGKFSNCGPINLLRQMEWKFILLPK